MLLREYAIDPQVMTDWDAAKALYEGMGACHGRMWNPVWEKGAWRSKVRTLVDVAEASGQIGPIHAASIKSKHLNRLNEAMWPTCPQESDATPWEDAVKKTHATHPYHAVITDLMMAGLPALTASEVGDHNTSWGVAGTVTAPRTATGLTTSVQGILRSSSHLIFIDPYLGKRLLDATMAKPMTAYIRAACPLHAVRSPLAQKIEIHTEKKPDSLTTRADWTSFTQQLCLTAMVQISLVWWDERTLHNRYILGDLCGAMFGTGLDMASSYSTQTDTVVRLSEEVRKEHWDKHVNQAITWQSSDPTRVW